MKKIIILLAFLLILGAACSEMPKDKQVDYEKDVKPLIAEDTDSSRTRGSCNAINFGSQCIDYIGAMWTPEQMKLNCAGDGRSFSLDGCPYTEIGGCQMTGGTVAEVIAWAYNYGGDPVDAEIAKYSAGACNSTLGSKWVYPDELMIYKN